jgi:hypothetical protein
VKAISELRIEITGGPRSDTLLVVMLTLLAVGVAVWAAVLAFQAQALEQIGMSRLTFWSAPSRRSRQYPPRRTWSRGDGHRLRNSKSPFQKAEVTPAGFGAAPGGAPALAVASTRQTPSATSQTRSQIAPLTIGRATANSG